MRRRVVQIKSYNKLGFRKTLMRILVVNGGLHHERAFRSRPEVQFIRSSDVRNASLESWNIVIVPFHTDRIVLAELRSKLERYVRRGGVLVVLGATEDDGRLWVPYAEWQGPYGTLVVGHRTDADGAAIFGGLADEELKYHGVYAAHGSLLPRLEQAVCLAVDENEQVVALVQRLGRGSYFCTTLDPDYHSCSQVPGPNEEETLETRVRAQRLLSNIFLWSCCEAANRPWWLRLWRRVTGSSQRAVRLGSFWAAVALPVVFLFWLSIRTSDTTPSLEKRGLILLSSLALVGSIFALWEMSRRWRA